MLTCEEVGEKVLLRALMSTKGDTSFVSKILNCIKVKILYMRYQIPEAFSTDAGIYRLAARFASFQSNVQCNRWLYVRIPFESGEIFPGFVE